MAFASLSILSKKLSHSHSTDHEQVLDSLWLLPVPESREKMLSHNHFMEPVSYIFTDLHPKYVV
jgi:hypothetical protein